MAASEKGVCAIALRGGGRELSRILSAGALPKLAPAPGGSLLLAEVRDWLDAILGEGEFRPLTVPLDPAPGHGPGRSLQQHHRQPQREERRGDDHAAPSARERLCVFWRDPDTYP